MRHRDAIAFGNSISCSDTDPTAGVGRRERLHSVSVDYTVKKWNFVSPYLLCFVSDANSGTAKLFQRVANGSFAPISHGGGDITVIDLEAYGVPASVATQLWGGLHTYAARTRKLEKMRRRPRQGDMFHY